MASTAPGRGQQLDKVDAVAHRRMRELQAVRAETEACRAATETLCRDTAAARVALDAAAGDYGRRKAELVDRETRAHGRLAEVLRDRSAAEWALEDVREHAENVLRARRTANTVRAYRLDARWRRLHGRYRGFVSDVLAGGGGGALQRLQQQRRQQQLRPSDAPRAPAEKTFGRRFCAAADHVSARHRRESLRTSRSLHALTSGYLRETSGGGDAHTSPADRRKTAASSRRRSSPVSLDGGAGPERVLDKLRVMQEQCTRIAERVRRRTAWSGAVPRPGRNRARDAADDDDDGRAARQADSLAEARQRLTAGRQYVAELRALTGRAAAEASREQHGLRMLLCVTCAACAGGKARLDGGGGGGGGCGGNDTAVQIAGRLERACFALFARLDRTGAGPAAAPSRTPPQRSAHAHDVVTSCLHAVQAHRMRTVQQARDVERRVQNFHKAVNRLLLATTARARSGRAARRTGGETSPGARRAAPSSAAGNAARGKVQARTFVSTGSSPKTTSAAADTAVAVESTKAVTVKILCPPSIGVVEYE